LNRENAGVNNYAPPMNGLESIDEKEELEASIRG
jgi:hypothetical protein